MGDVIPLCKTSVQNTPPGGENYAPDYAVAVADLPPPPWERDELTARRYERLIEELEREREAELRNGIAQLGPPRLRLVR